MGKKHGPWTINGTERKYQNEFIQVNEDQVTQPDGKASTYATVQTQQGVSILPLDAEGNVYLVKQFRYAAGKESLEASSGGLNVGESPLQAARREAHEELGIEAEDWRELGVVDPDTSIFHGPVIVFLARGLKFTQTEREGTETMKVVKLSLAEAVHKVMQGEITHAPSCILILKAERVINQG